MTTSEAYKTVSEKRTGTPGETEQHMIFTILAFLAVQLSLREHHGPRTIRGYAREVEAALPRSRFDARHRSRIMNHVRKPRLARRTPIWWSPLRTNPARS